VKKRFLIVLAATVAVNLLGSAQNLAPQRKGTAGAASSEATKTRPAVGLIDINSASIDELKSLPGTDEAYAKKIVDNRPYKRKDELVKKQVISQATYDEVADEITASKAK
jgi:competence protein ComEA